MKIKLIHSIIFGALIVPALAFAQTGTTTTGTTTVATTTATSTKPKPNKSVFVLCAQNAVEKRDTTISNARVSYSASMKLAIDARKVALIAALEIADAQAQTQAKKAAIEIYKKAQRTAQNTFSVARKNAWTTFEAEMKACRVARDLNKDTSKSDRKSDKNKMKEDRKEWKEERDEEKNEWREDRKDERDVTNSAIMNIRAEAKIKIEALKDLFQSNSDSR